MAPVKHLFAICHGAQLPHGAQMKHSRASIQLVARVSDDTIARANLETAFVGYDDDDDDG